MKKKEWLSFLSSESLKKLLRVMRLGLLLLLISFSVTWGRTYSQETKFSLELENSTIRQIIELIEEQSEFVFIYKNEVVDIDRTVNIDLKNVTIEKVLDVILKDDVEYVINDRQVIIKEIDGPPQNNDQIIQQEQKTVNGIVSDENGMPLPGVSIIVKGTTIGTITDVDGNYSLNVPSDAKILIFSFVGMEKQEVSIKEKSIINVALSPSTIGLEEVVAVGYGTMKKANLTGAVGVASAERLENRAITSLGQGLQGVIPGLNITYDSGDPNEAADFNIRGFESINGGTPLILVDGIPLDINRINPDDIESVSVLKDASSAAVYGARAAFGVILVTTKKGKTGKPKVSFSAKTTLQKRIFPGYEPLTGQGGTIRELSDSALWVTRKKRNFPQEVIDAAYAYQEMSNPKPEDEWYYYEPQDMLYFLGTTYQADLSMNEVAPQHQYNLSLSGASEKISYYVSLAAIGKEGFMKFNNEKYNRYNALTKLDIKINDWFSLDNKMSFTLVKNDVPHNYMPGNNGYLLYNSYTSAPYFPYQFPDLEYYRTPGDREEFEHLIGLYDHRFNPTPFLKYGGRDTENENDILFSQGITISPIEGLKIRGDFSYNSYWSDKKMVQSEINMVLGRVGFKLGDPNIITQAQSADDLVKSEFLRRTYVVASAYAEYTAQNLDNHDIKALVGFNQEYGYRHFVSTSTKDLITPSTPSLSAGTDDNKSNSESAKEIMLRGLFYRLTYSYKDKYLFEANGRYDGTSRFPKESRFGFFPSFSVGWRISEEPFMAWSNEWLDYLKLRASYGELGNQSVGSYYPYISSMTSGNGGFLLDGGGKRPMTMAPGGLVGNSLTWETVLSKNLGIDIRTLNKKLYLSFDYFIRDTKDMLMNKDYPDVIGAEAPSENAADLRNEGWEFAATLADNIGRDWSYSLNLSLSDYQTTITKYDNPTGAINDYYVGKKIGEIWGYKTVGLFQTNEEVENAADQSRIGTGWAPGDVHYADLDGDGIITKGSQTLDDHGDLIRIGNKTPRFSYGVNPVIKYKNFTLDIFAQGMLKRDYYPSTSNYLRFFPFKYFNVEQWWLDDSWCPDNTDAYFPRIHNAYSDSKNIQTQTRYLQNAAYLRLKSVTLSYDINRPLKFVESAMVYFNGANLWEIHGMYKSLDPDWANTRGTYLFQRGFTLGVKLTL